MTSQSDRQRDSSEELDLRDYTKRYAATVRGNFVDGGWVSATGTDTIAVTDPSTGQTLGRVPASTAADVDAAVLAAADAQPAWAALTPARRSKLLLRLADTANAHFEEFVALESVDAGKPSTFVRNDELPDIIDAIRYFAGAARVLSAPAGQDYLEGISSTLRREPMGVVAGITPWNYPLLQAIAKIVPALATGNTVVIKPAETTPYSTARFVELAGEVLPPGVLNIVFGDGKTAGDALARHSQVDVVSFTGSVDTGKRVGAVAAEGVKKAIMELGGNAPVVVFADADIERSLDTIFAAGVYNSGQDCMAASRIIAHRSIESIVIDGLQKRLAGVVIGDVTEADTTLGPLNSQLQLERVERKIAELPGTARIVTGGGRLDRPGFFLAPTIITDVKQTDLIVQEEIFGPVFTVQAFDEEDEAIQMANGTRYGLAASVFTSSVRTSTRLQNVLQYGTVWINNHLVFGPDLPTSGFRQSGTGVENGEPGILEFTRLKHVMVDYS